MSGIPDFAAAMPLPYGLAWCAECCGAKDGPHPHWAHLELDRLRAVIKFLETAGERGVCPWCYCKRSSPHDEPHFDSCMAFRPDGTVR